MSQQPPPQQQQHLPPQQYPSSHPIPSQQQGSGGRGGPPQGMAGRGPMMGGGGGRGPYTYANYLPPAGGRGGMGTAGAPAAVAGTGAAQPPLGSWQPTDPTSLSHAAAYRPNPYSLPAPNAPYYASPYVGQVPPPPPPHFRGGPWPGEYPPPQGMRGGGMYFPPPPPQHPGAAVAAGATGVLPTQPAVVPARPKKPLVVTDKQGNVIDLFSAASSATKKTSLQQAAAAGNTAEQQEASTTAKASSDAGAKFFQAALERKNNKVEKKNKAPSDEVVASATLAARHDEEEKAREAAIAAEKEESSRKEAEEHARIEAKAKAEADEIARIEAEEKARIEAEEKARIEAEEKARAEAEEKTKKEAAEERARQEAEEKQEKEKKVAAASAAVSSQSSGNGVTRRVYTKAELLRFKEMPSCLQKPDTLPDMTVSKGPSRNRSTGNRRDNQRSGGGGGSGGGGNMQSASIGGGAGADGGGGDWQRGQNRRQSGGGVIGDQGQWSRGQAPPKGQNQRGNRRGQQKNQSPVFDEPVVPLVKSENHWKPKKNTSALVVAEKKVKSILNKMTKEKFERLSAQMMEIEILNMQTLDMMIDNIYDKAIDEPSFGDMYADLCALLSQNVQVSQLVHIIESDEEPPTEDGKAGSTDQDSSHYTVYRWSNDVSTNDEQIVGPLDSIQDCIDAALDEEERNPIERGEMNLELVKVCIKRGVFMKCLKKKDAKDDQKGAYYTVYFPVAEAEELGQQLSDIFLSQIECESDSTKKNSFKSSLLNKCEEEFNKQDIYVDWKAEKKAYEESKSTLTEAARAEKEEELEFRRMRIKKQMLGNVKFIGQLFKKKLLKEKVMRYCIGRLLKLTQLSKEEYKGKNPEYRDSGETDLDEEDHEAVCNLFATIGSTIDTLSAQRFMDVCFTKIEELSTSKEVPARCRFLYKDLLDLRENRWEPRRKVEKAKTLEEIRKDVEQEERINAQQSQQAQRSSGKDFNTRQDFNARSSGRGSDFRSPGSMATTGGSIRPRQARQPSETDDEGFTKIGTKGNPPTQRPSGKLSVQQQPRAPPVASKSTSYSALAEDGQTGTKSGPASLTDEQLKRKIDVMRNEFLVDGGNVGELMLTFDEISGTPDAGERLVSINLDRLMECKTDEREAIYKIISTLVEKGKLTKDEVRSGCSTSVEYIDSTVLDCPRAYEFLGCLFGHLLKLKAIDISWLCDQLEKTKTDPVTQAPEKVTFYTLKSLRDLGGSLVMKAAIPDENVMKALLGESKWTTISKELSQA